MTTRASSFLRIAHLSLIGLAWLAVLAATPARASNVVQVRVGNHPTFTRVVFELDAPSGYRIERDVLEDGTHEIRVTIEAASSPRSVRSRSPQVELVTVQHGEERSVAHIRLRKASPRLKELILADPPRLVFDLAKEGADLLAGAEPDPAGAHEPSPSPGLIETAELEEIIPEPMAPRTPPPLLDSEPERDSEPGPSVEVASVPEAGRLAEATGLEHEAAPAPLHDSPVLEPPGSGTEIAAENAGGESSASSREQGIRDLPLLPSRTAPIQQRPPVPPPLVAETEPDEDGSGFSTLTLAAAGAGVIFLVILVVALLRRRTLPSDLDVASLASEGRDDGMQDDGFAIGDTEATPDLSSGRGASGETRTPLAGPGLFDDTDRDLFDGTDKGEKAMDHESQDLPIQRTESEMPTQMGAASVGDSDVARIVRELDRRVAQLETRLDEAVDARERLERQVAAQSEELRVQRAAIARTQRALRSLNRSDEEQATEPALREPRSAS